jgi:ferredoxin
VLELVRDKLRLSIIDGITGMDDEGPANGRVRDFGLIMAGVDAVAFDAAVYSLFGVNSARIPLVKLCAEKRLGETMARNIKIFTPDGAEFLLSDKVPLAPYLVKDPKLPKTHIVNYIPEFAGKMLSHFVWIKPRITAACRLCGKCAEICPASAIEEYVLQEKKRLRVNRAKCISCFCCNEVCPYGTIVIEESLPLKAVRKILDVIR